MRTRRPYRLPEEKRDALRKAVVLEWVTIVALLSIAVVMYLAMGSSQAMKTAWIEDVLSLIPPIVFLVALRFRDREPSEHYPYGYRRAMLLSFMIAAVALLVLGLYMLYDALRSLIAEEHPTLGHFHLFGDTWEIWSGWIMIAALLYSMVPPVILGRMKLPLAEELHEKTLHADAKMNKADWTTAGAAILGILGVGAGLWWADAAAAGLIALDITRDGVVNVRRAFADLMDQRPTDVASDEPSGLEGRLREALLELSDVRDAEVRLREEGDVVSGEAFVALAADDDVASRLQRISEHAVARERRVHELIVVPVATLERGDDGR